MILSSYETNVRDILNDPSAIFYSKTLLDRLINRARVRVSKRAQCIRQLTPGSASVTSYTQVSGGSGYTSTPTVTVSGPDMVSPQTFTQATATATVSSGAVSAVSVNVAGSGYVKAPTVTISGGGGSGASFTANLGTHMTTTAGQDLYTFASITSSLAGVTGVQAVIDILNVSVAYAGVKPTLAQSDFGYLQALLRSYSTGQQYPAIWARYARGESGSFYMYPAPSDTFAMECDCVCTPINLVDDTTVDLIPDAWTDAVFYLAASYAFENAQRRDDAKAMQVEYMTRMMEASENTGSMLVPSYYGSDD